MFESQDEPDGFDSSKENGFKSKEDGFKSREEDFELSDNFPLREVVGEIVREPGFVGESGAEVVNEGTVMKPNDLVACGLIAVMSVDSFRASVWSIAVESPAPIVVERADSCRRFRMSLLVTMADIECPTVKLTGIVKT
jgi:hypothetical protein